MLSLANLSDYFSLSTCFLLHGSRFPTPCFRVVSDQFICHLHPFDFDSQVYHYLAMAR